MSRVAQRFVSLVCAAALVAGGLFAVTAVTGGAPAAAAPAPTQEADDSVYTADALPTAQMDGVAWAQVIVGDTVFVGGRFATARPAGAAAGVNTVPRANFLAYSLTTGKLDTSWAPQFNGQVKALTVSPDGATLYVGGDFTSVDGQLRNRVAAFDLATRTLKANFAPDVNNTVNAIAVSGSKVYLGGDFTKINGIWRIRLAAVAAVNGVVSGWSAQADRLVTALVFTPDGSKLVVAGNFEYLNTSSLAQGMGALDPTTGATATWNDGIASFGANAGFTSLRTDGSSVYATSFNYGAPPGFTQHQFEGTVKLDPADGSIQWMEDCHGDSYDSFATPTTVYSVGHAHDCRSLGGFGDMTEAQADALNIGDKWQRTLAFTSAATGTLNASASSSYKSWTGTPSPSVVAFFPFLQSGTVTGQSQAAWTVTGTSKYLVMGGEFPAVNANPQQGLVRFAVPSVSATHKQGPRLSATQSWTPTATALSGGRVRVTIPANWDRDDLALRYSLFRDGTATPVATATASSVFWSRPTVTLVDTTAPAGATASYTVVASDGDGNTATSVAVTATTPAASSYATEVLSDAPSLYWRLNDTAAGKLVNATGDPDGAMTGTVTRSVVGALAGDTDRAMTFNGAQAWSPSTTAGATDGWSAELWVKTSSTLGGGIASFGNATSGTSTTVARALYLDNAGRIHFGTTTGATKTDVASPRTYRDNAWHQVVVTQGPAGMVLYVDGAAVASAPAATQGLALTGSWRLGAENLTGWANQPTRSYLTGTFDEFAVYPTVLSAARVAEHANAGGLSVPVPNAAPTAAFTSAADGVSVQVDGSTSADPDGRIASYRWSWGDGTADTTGAAATASHAYAASGTYTVTLTVTDNRGATGSTSAAVTVVKPNAVPTAAFTSTADALALSVDGSTSADSDGSIAGYRWSWGDGSDDTTGTAATASHTYAAAGTYTVTLTVTDDKGATGTRSASVTVAQRNVAPTAAFTRSAAGLTLSVDGSTSADSDGSIAGYRWSWGDGTADTTGTTATATHPYAAGGTYTVTLTVTDDKGATATASADVTVTKPNVAPTAAFTADTTGLTLSVDGSTSADSDGSIAGYRWSWGDGTADTTGTTATATHDYAASGTWTVTLTVTDDRGATATASRSVSATAGARTLAADAFGRTTAGGWGSADQGGAWTLVGSAARFSTDGATGRMTVPTASTGLSAYLAGVQAADVTGTVDVTVDKALVAPVLIAQDLRRTATGSYRVKARIAADGTVQLSTVKVIGGAETTLRTVTVAGLVVATGDTLRMTATVSGSTISGSVWKVGTTAPAAAQVSSTDTAVTGAGSVGLWTYLASTTTNVPLTFSFDNYTVVSAG